MAVALAEQKISYKPTIIVKVKISQEFLEILEFKTIPI